MREHWSEFDIEGFEMGTITAVNSIFLGKVNQTIKEAKERNLITGAHSLLRADLFQKNLYALGRTIRNPDGVSPEKPLGNIVTKSQDALSSWHGYGLAGDIVFLDEKGNWTWSGMPRVTKTSGGYIWNKAVENRWHELAKVAAMFGLEWGGDWTRVEPDFPHFQMKGGFKNTLEARKVYTEQGIEAVWKRAEIV